MFFHSYAERSTEAQEIPVSQPQCYLGFWMESRNLGKFCFDANHLCFFIAVQTARTLYFPKGQPLACKRRGTREIREF